MKNFVFDLYNTLIEVRTDEHCERAWTPVCRYFADNGIDVGWKKLNELFDAYWADFKAQAKSSPFAYPECDCVEQFSSMARSLGGELTKEQAAEALCIMRKASIEKLRPFDGVPELFSDLRARGARLYLLSNAQAAFTYGEIEECGLSDKFDGMLISSEHGCRKPDPAFFKILFDKFELDKRESVMVGDDKKSDGEGAKAFGIKYVFTPGGAAKFRDKLVKLAETK